MYLLPSEGSGYGYVFEVRCVMEISEFDLLLTIFDFLATFATLCTRKNTSSIGRGFTPVGATVPSLSVTPSTHKNTVNSGNITAAPSIGSRC